MKLAVRTHLFLARLRDEKGASAVEYGLLVALIAAVIVGTVLLLGETLLGAFTETNTEINKGGGDGA